MPGHSSGWGCDPISGHGRWDKHDDRYVCKQLIEKKPDFSINIDVDLLLLVENPKLCLLRHCNVLYT